MKRTHISFEKPKASGAAIQRLALRLGAVVMAAGIWAANPHAGAAASLLAHYTFDNTAADATGNNSPARLLNTTFTNHSLYLNGIYELGGGLNGYSAVANVPRLSYQSFTFGINFLPMDFLTVCPPEATMCSRHNNIITGGYLTRWISFKHGDGHLSLKLNNWRNSYEFPEVNLLTGVRQQVICSVDLPAKRIITFFGGRRLHEITLPEDFELEVIGSPWEQGDKAFMFSDLSSGDVFHGYVDNLFVFDAALTAEQIELLIVNASPEVTPPPAAVLEADAPAELIAQVSDREGNPMVVIWSLEGTAVQTNALPATSPGAITSVSLAASFSPGSHTLEVRASDGTNVTAAFTSLTALDTTPPVITRAVASPRVLWPVDRRMVSVNVEVSTSDNSGHASWSIVSVRSSNPEPARARAGSPPDWIITSDSTVLLRAEDSAKGRGRMARVYYLTVQAFDASGNQSQARTVTVTVPQSRGRLVEPTRRRGFR